MKNFGEFFNNQIEAARCIVLSHTDGLSEEKLHECMHLLKEKNSNAIIVSTSWDKLSSAQIISAIEGASSIKNEIEELKDEACPVCGSHHGNHNSHHHSHEHDHEHCHHEHHEHEHHHEHEDGHCCCGHDHHEHHEHHHDEHCCCGHDHKHSHHHDEHHHHADEVFQSVGIETAKKFAKDEISAILNALSDKEKYGVILRAKGYVAAEGEDWIYFDYIPETPDVRYGAADVCGRICVIGADINADAIKELFGV